MTMYKIFHVGEHEYKVKLTTSATIAVEDKIGGNILDPVMNMGEIEADQDGKVNAVNIGKTSLPSVKYMATVLWGGLQKYHHNITFSKVMDLLDEYFDSGKTQFDLFTFIMEFFTETGILGTENEGQVEQIEKVEENLM